jgi:hypothetical protein
VAETSSGLCLLEGCHVSSVESSASATGELVIRVGFHILKSQVSSVQSLNHQESEG